MLFGKKKPEKAKGMGGIFSLLGGILILVSFFMPFTGKFEVAKQKASVKALLRQMDGQAPKKAVNLFKLAKRHKILFAIPALGLLAVLIGAYLFKLALFNIFVGAGCLYFSLFSKPLAAMGISLLMKHPGMGMGSLGGGVVLVILGGLMTTKRNFGGGKKKKKKKEPKKKKKK